MSSLSPSRPEAESGELATRNLASLESYLAGLERQGVKLGLERVKILLDLCGNPHESPVCIHVAGTNGKGSVCALVESILRATGFRTGLYTSPHLVSYGERIQICGKKVREELLLDCAGELIPKAESMSAGPEGMPSYFEFTTALAFACFAKERVDYAVLEVGLGGRLDATNVVRAPVVAITSIDYEHQDQLGDTLALIAGEKAAIIKEGARVVCGAMDREAIRVIERLCGEKRATLLRIDSDIIWRIFELTPLGSALSFGGECGPYADIFLPLAGRHQAANCAIALGIIEELRRCGVKISKEAARRGIAETRWPGRLEIIRNDPLLLVDCAHNPSGARAIAASVKEIFQGRRWVIVLGVFIDKNIGEICDALMPLASAVVTTKVASARSADARLVADECRKRTEAEVRVASCLNEALSLAREDVAENRADSIFLTGSIYLVGEALKLAGVEPFS